MPIYTNIAGADQAAPVESTPVSSGEGDLAAISAGYQQAPGVTLIQAGIAATRGGPMLSHDEAAKRMTDQGYDASHVPQGGMTEGALGDVMTRQSILKRDAYTVQQSGNGGVRQFADGMVGGFVDPINLATIALAPEAKIGQTFAEKALIGGLTGAAVQGGASLAQMPAAQAMGDDYKMSDVFQNVVLGTLTGGVLHGITKGTPVAARLTTDDVVALEGSHAAAAQWNKAHPDQPITSDDVTSHTGAVGLHQIEPATARGLGLKGTDAEITAQLKNPDTNKAMSQSLLDQLAKRYKGDPEAQAIAYNDGPSRADAWIKAGRDDSVLPKETRGYVERYRAAHGMAPSDAGQPATRPFGQKPADDPPDVQANLLKTALGQVAEDSKVNVEPVRAVAMDEHWGVGGRGVDENPYRTNPMRIADEHENDVNDLISQAFQDAAPKRGSAEHTDAPIVNEKFTPPTQPEPVRNMYTNSGQEAGPRTADMQAHLANDMAELKAIPEGIRKEGEPETVAADKQIKQTADLHTATEAAVNCGAKRGTE